MPRRSKTGTSTDAAPGGIATVPVGSDAALVVSGGARDGGRTLMWITSDTARTIFPFDPEVQKAVRFLVKVSPVAAMGPFEYFRPSRGGPVRGHKVGQNTFEFRVRPACRPVERPISGRK